MGWGWEGWVEWEGWNGWVRGGCNRVESGRERREITELLVGARRSEAGLEGLCGQVATRQGGAMQAGDRQTI